MTTNTAKMFMNTMILLHITYCLTSWGHINKTTLKPIESLYKQTIKTLDKKPQGHHHCKILNRHSLLSWENMIKYNRLYLVFKILHNMAPPTLQTYITLKTSRTTRETAREDYIIPRRQSSFGQSSFSVRASQDWKNIQQHIRNCPNCHEFSTTLRAWFIRNQTCEH